MLLEQLDLGVLGRGPGPLLAQGLPPFDAEITWLSSQAEEKEDWGDGGYFEAYARPVGEVPPGIAPGMSVMGRVLDREAGP